MSVATMHGQSYGCAVFTAFNSAEVILLIVIVNAALGFMQEWRTENAIAFLKKLSAPAVKVRRNGTLIMIPARELVTSDLMVMELKSPPTPLQIRLSHSP